MKHTITEIVKDTRVIFHSYNSDSDEFTYIVELSDGTVYSFPVDRKDVGNATISAEEKGLTFMRWIRKAIGNGLLLEITKPVIVEKDFTFSFYRAGFIYYKDSTGKEFPIDITELKEKTMFNVTENLTTLQQWIQQAQQQCQSES